MGLRITQVTEAIVKVTVQKTGKTYYRTMNYAKHVIIGATIEGTKNHEYYLREGRKWKKVSEEEFKQGTSKEAEQKIHEQLSRELREKVEREMKEKHE